MESGIYISDDKINTYVVFGGRIGFAVGKSTLNSKEYKLFGIQQLDKTYNVGETISDSEKWEYHKQSVHLLFDNEKSIDVLIKALGTLKDKFNKKE